MRTLPLALSAALPIAALGPAVAAPKFEPPPEIAAHTPSDLRSYYVALKVSPGERKPMPDDVFVQHQAYIRAQTEKKVYQLVGPITDGGRIRGLTILTAGSLEEARRIVSEDPAVKAGILAVEVHPAVFPNLDSLKIEYGTRP